MVLGLGEISKQMDYTEKIYCLSEIQSTAFRLYRVFRNAPSNAINAKYAALLYLRCRQLYFAYSEDVYDEINYAAANEVVNDAMIEVASITDYDLTAEISNGKIDVYTLTICSAAEAAFINNDIDLAMEQDVAKGQNTIEKCEIYQLYDRSWIYEIECWYNQLIELTTGSVKNEYIEAKENFINTHADQAKAAAEASCAPSGDPQYLIDVEEIEYAYYRDTAKDIFVSLYSLTEDVTFTFITDCPTAIDDGIYIINDTDWSSLRAVAVGWHIHGTVANGESAYSVDLIFPRNVELVGDFSNIPFLYKADIVEILLCGVSSFLYEF
jgi:hypothetical protein